MKDFLKVPAEETEQNVNIALTCMIPRLVAVFLSCLIILFRNKLLN